MIKLKDLLNEVNIEDIKTPFYFKSKKGIEGMDKNTTFLVKDIPSYSNIKVYYYDGTLERFLFMYKTHFQKHLDNADYYEVKKSEFKPLKK